MPVRVRPVADHPGDGLFRQGVHTVGAVDLEGAPEHPVEKRQGLRMQGGRGVGPGQTGSGQVPLSTHQLDKLAIW